MRVPIWGPQQNQQYRAGRLTGCSVENRGQLCQHFIHDRGGNAFQFLAAAGFEIERAGLIAADDARGLGPGARQGHGEPSGPREVSSAGNGKNHRHCGHLVERLGRNDQHGAAAFLLMAPAPRILETSKIAARMDSVRGSARRGI
jgi:hypothetical protein